MKRAPSVRALWLGQDLPGGRPFGSQSRLDIARGAWNQRREVAGKALAYIFTRGVAEPPGQDELLQVSVSHLGRRCLPRPLEKASLFSDWLRRLPVGLETPGFGSQCCHLPVVCSWTSYLIPQAQGFLICKLGMLILSL